MTDDDEPPRLRPTRPIAFTWNLLWHDFPVQLALLVGTNVLAQVLESFEPLALKNLLDRTTRAITGGTQGPYEVEVAVLALFGVWIGSALFFRAYQIVDIYTGPPVRSLVQKRMFAWLIGQSSQFFHNHFAAALAQKIKQGSQAVLGVMEIFFFDVTRIFVLSSVAFALLARISSILAMIFLVWMLAYTALSAWFARSSVERSALASAAASSSLGVLADSIANIDLVRGFAQFRRERHYVGAYIDREERESRKLRWFLAAMRSFQLLSMGALLTSLLWLSSRQALTGRFSIGDLGLVFAICVRVTNNFWTLSNRMLDFFERLGTLSDALRVIFSPHAICDRPGAQPLVVTAGSVEFLDVHFRFPDGAPILNGLTVRIEPGEKIGLVGRSGVGKSTLLRLLRRQFELQQGRILVDGQDIRSVTLESLSHEIVEVPQQPSMFHRTIGENIAYGRPAASQQDVEVAARRAHAHEFITRRTDAYQTTVGDLGAKLSGGERQRVAIARAFLKDCRILILDEATAALDSESEFLVQQAMWALMEKRTVIAIAHRLSTLVRMDRILFLEDGRVVEQGTHPDLLAMRGRYAALWEKQTAEER